MHKTTCFALQVKRPSSLPTVHDQTDIVKQRRSAHLEALEFDSRITSHSNATARDTATVTPCGQNGATSQMDYALRIPTNVLREMSMSNCEIR